jgi:prevent-host-death family protein
LIFLGIGFEGRLDTSIPSRSHDTYWEMVKQAGAVPQDSEYDGYRRGRVAKTHLADLPDRVSRREKIKITRHGVPAAMPVPVEETRVRMTHKEIVEGMRKLRKRIKPGKMSVRQMVEEGRRF